MILSAQDLRKSYKQPGGNVDVLQGVNLDIERGETVAILGQSGSGKSTLLSLLAGLDHPTAGSIAVAGQNINQMSEKSLAKFRAAHLGIVFQQFHLMSSLTAVENVALPLEIFHQPDAEQRARAALDKVGLSHRIHHFPAELSGGEKQRVAIARAFVVTPDLLLADEPSGNLDSATGTQVMDLIFELSAQRQTTLILVTHNHGLASRCDRIFHLNQGQLREKQYDDAQ